MKNTTKQKRISITLCTIAALLILGSLMCSADLIASIETDKQEYQQGEDVTFDAVLELTECETLDSVKLNINGPSSITCSLPKQYGYYPSYGNCELEITVEESNPDNCYTYGGENTITYEIIWQPSAEYTCGTYTAELIAEAYDESVTESTSFEIICPTTTSTTCPTTSTITSTSTTVTGETTSSTSTSTTTEETTSTTKSTKKKSSGGGGSRYINPPKIVSSCKDGIQNYGETDVDCGGPCTPCDDGKRCLRDSDCKSENCIDGICRKMSCTDDTRNQDETDVDCGGETCDGCDDGKRCLVDADCKSNYCEDNICSQKFTCEIPETCSDGTKNQDETDVDCGGGACRQCSEGKSCFLDADCLDGYCMDNTCTKPTCSDGIKNQDEEEIDCGGPCSACPPTGIIGYITAVSGDLGNLLLLLIILLLLGVLFMYLSKKKRYVATADFLSDIESEEDLEKFINKKKPYVVAGTSRKIRRLKRFIDEGKIDIVWIKDWDHVNELISKGLDDNSAESIALAKQLKAGLYTSNPDAMRLADEAGIKVYESV